jgi:hypothetical protein
MNSRRTWLAGAAFVVVLVLAGLVTTTALAQATPPPGGPGVGICGASAGMMGSGVPMANSDAMLAAHSARMEAAVAASWLTQAQADAMTAAMHARIESGFRPGAAWPGMIRDR